MGRTHQPFVPHELGSSWTWTRWIKGCPSCSLNVPSLSRSILLPYVLNKRIQCFFKLLCPSSCDWPNWHLQWVVGMITLGVGLIRIRGGDNKERKNWKNTLVVKVHERSVRVSLLWKGNKFIKVKLYKGKQRG